MKRQTKKNMLGALLPFTIGAGAPAFWGLLFTPVFTKILGAEEYGILGFYQSILDFIWIFSVLGMNTFVLRECYLIEESERHKLFQDIFSFLIAWNLFLCLILLPLLSYLINKISGQIPTAPYVGIVLMTNFLKIFYILPIIIFRLRVMAVSFMIYSLSIGLLVNFGSLLFLRQAGAFAWAKMAGLIPIYAVITLACLVFLFRHSRCRFQTHLLGRAIRFSYPLIVVNFFLYFSGNFDRILIQHFTSKSLLGIYTVGKSLANIFQLLVNGLYQFGEPLFFKDFSRSEFTTSLCNNNLQLMLSALSLCAICLALSPELLVNMFVRNETLKQSVDIIPLLLSSILLTAGLAYVMLVFLCFGKTKIYAIVAIIAATSVLSIEFALLPHIGYYAPPLATACSLSVIYIASLYTLKNKYGVKLKFLRLILLLVYPALAIILTSSQFVTSLFVKLAILLPITVLCGLTIVQSFGHPKVSNGL